MKISLDEVEVKQAIVEWLADHYDFAILKEDISFVTGDNENPYIAYKFKANVLKEIV